MLDLLWLVPAAPLAGFIFLTISGDRTSRTLTALVGTGSVFISALIAALVGISFVIAPPEGHAYSQTLWTWLSVASFSSGITFYLDPLSLVMIVVISFVGFLIHLYSTEFMRDDEGYRRFFAYMNLFVCSMLILVLADNLLLLYLGWEGVGLCSYLLIGFWYKNPANGRAAMKAFIVTRIGDTSLAIGLLVLYTNLGTLRIQELMRLAWMNWPEGSVLAVAAAALILGGAVGKSAQLPLQTWLPDAMAGPTPVSALIHAATMVTAGVYLIARTHLLFQLAPAAQAAVAYIGAATLLIAGISALAQKDLKRVLAYSTISQIGYMFLALGVGAWSAAIFHFMTHAFFKALLFLAAGVVIIGLNEEHDIFKMGGLRKRLPLTFWTFLAGAASLSALPLFTAGFYSKDLILRQVWTSASGGTWLWAAGAAGSLLTALYAFRMVFLVFFGEIKSEVIKRPGRNMLIPLVVLALLAILGGYVGLPVASGGVPIFSDYLKDVLPSSPTSYISQGGEAAISIVTGTLPIIGIIVAYMLFLRNPGYIRRLTSVNPGMILHRFWLSGWGFDRLYDAVIIRPFVQLARMNKDDVVDLLFTGVEWYSSELHSLLSRTQTGVLRRYAAWITLAAIIVIAVAVLA